MKELESLLDFRSEKEIKILSKFLKLLRRFRGISVSFLKLQLNEWDGYGISFLTIAIFRGGCSSSRAFFFINIYTDHSMRGKEIRIMGGIFFMYRKLYSKVIRNKKDRCEQCGDFCETKEFYDGDIPYCSEECKDF